MIVSLIVIVAGLIAIVAALIAMIVSLIAIVAAFIAICINVEVCKFIRVVLWLSPPARERRADGASTLKCAENLAQSVTLREGFAYGRLSRLARCSRLCITQK
jgi:hypothetical protein